MSISSCLNCIWRNYFIVFYLFMIYKSIQNRKTGCHLFVIYIANQELTLYDQSVHFSNSMKNRRVDIFLHFLHIDAKESGNNSTFQKRRYVHFTQTWFSVVSAHQLLLNI